MAGYRVHCPFCHTQIRGPHGGVYREFVSAVKNLKTHWRISCNAVPQMGRKEKDVIAESNVEEAVTT
jgi:hypothetical protein